MTYYAWVLMHVLLSFTTMLLVCVPLLAEENKPCGVQTTKVVAQEVATLVEGGHWNDALSTPLMNRGTQYVKTTIHIVRYSNGSGGIPEERIATAIETLNDSVAETGLVFVQFGDILYLNSSLYATCTSGEVDALRQINPVDESLNIYFVPEFVNYCGVSSFYGWGVQGIVLDNDCTATSTNPSTFSHEVGHYFGLFHTHEPYYGLECVNGSNCDVAGDLICDTPADPNLSGNINSSCAYTGSATDACGSGNPYMPLANNMMSYSTKVCRTNFTDNQLSVFLWTAENERADHLANSPYDCLGDATGDTLVGVNDILVIVSDWESTNSPGDVNGDGIVSIKDILIVLANWGACN